MDAINLCHVISSRADAEVPRGFRGSIGKKCAGTRVSVHLSECWRVHQPLRGCMEVTLSVDLVSIPARHPAVGGWPSHKKRRPPGSTLEQSRARGQDIICCVSAGKPDAITPQL